jgi:hypothetical protein
VYHPELGQPDKNNVMAKATAKNKVSVKDISALAKKTRKPGEKWTDAIKRAAQTLKKEGN